MRPSNWYDMDYDSQRAWERNDRQRRDAEYERDCLQDDLESQARCCRREHQDYQSQIDAIRSENGNMISELEQEIDSLREETSLFQEWLKLKGMSAEFDEWASFRRTS
jgi:hypothetical protein